MNLGTFVAQGSRMATNNGCSKRKVVPWGLELGLVSGYFGKDIPLSPSGALVWICVVFFGSGSSFRQPRVEILSFPLSVAPVP